MKSFTDLPNFSANLALLCVSVLIAALLLELGVVFIVGEQAKFSRHVLGAPFGLRINEPNATYRHKSADVTIRFKINGQGMRASCDYPYNKPLGVKRILSLGDSFTVGYEVDNNETFSSVIERELRSRGVAIEVLNAGVSGYSTAEECLYLERELLRYDPDLVLVSFFANDLVDNERTNLFRLERDQLVQSSLTYVPAGWLGNFLNTNPFFNFLSERSSAFVLIKERATQILKRDIVEANRRNLRYAISSTPFTHHDAGGQEGNVVYQRKLASAIFERMYRTTWGRGLPLLIQSIPLRENNPNHLVETFPLEDFNVHRRGIWFFPAKRILDPQVGKELLYWEHSQGHWTPYSHALAGRALATLIFDEHLLELKQR